MSRLNTKKLVTATSPITTVGPAVTYEGGTGYVNDAYGELFRLGVNMFAGEDTFYESGKSRDKRFTDLVEQIAITDPAWLLSFLRWLRQEGNIRTASLMGAAHAVHARLAAGIEDGSIERGEKGMNRLFISAVPQRADEPGELAAYWTEKFGRTIPSAVKRGLADAANRLFNEYSLMKYDTASHGWRFGDVIQMTHPRTFGVESQSDLYRYAMTRRYGNEADFDLSNLPMIRFNADLRAQAASDPSVLLDPSALKFAGMTWEDALSLAGSKLDKGKLWDALVMGGSVGHMAMLRNLRNMQEAGVSKATIAKVQADLCNPEIVARGRQFPFRYWSAYKNASSTAWAHSLEEALTLSVGNIPLLNGRTDVYVDTSASMDTGMSNKSSIRRAEAGALFGIATAMRNPDSRLFIFADNVREVKVERGGSLLRQIEKVNRMIGAVGHGTNTAESIRTTTSPSTKRAVVFTDMQSMGSRSYGGYGYGGNVSDSVPESTYLYAFDLSGYAQGDIPSGNGRRHQLAGLTDSAFKMMDLIERSHSAAWPWEK